MENDRPAGVLVPTTRQSNPIGAALRRVARDGVWHRVGDRMGGSTAEQYARRLNQAVDIAGIDVSWIFGYKDLGEFSELWAKWVGTGNTK